MVSPTHRRPPPADSKPGREPDAPGQIATTPSPAGPRAAFTEADRLATLSAYGILDTDPEAGFDDIAQLAAQICGTPVAAVTFIDEDRQWFKATVGMGDLGETERSVAFCAHAIEDPDNVLVVDDATRDRRFTDNRLVTEGPGVRFYAGAPMVAEGGAALGTVCVIDLVPRQLTAEQQEALRALSRQAVALLEARRSLRRLATSVGARERAEVSARAALERLRMTFTHAPVGMMITGVDGVLVEVNDALAGMLGHAPEALVGVHFAELTAGEDMESENALAARGRAGEIDTVVRSKRYRHADGSLIPAISTSSVIRDDDGKPLTVIIPERLRSAHLAGLARVAAGASRC